MKRTIRLTESDLHKIIMQVINESGDFTKDGALYYQGGENHDKFLKKRASWIGQQYEKNRGNENYKISDSGLSDGEKERKHSNNMMRSNGWMGNWDSTHGAPKTEKIAKILTGPLRDLSDVLGDELENVINLTDDEKTFFWDIYNRLKDIVEELDDYDRNYERPT
ncbi:MAG: hypothetical protein II670_06095 [Alphaproteobacteria bacterium]|nr:hypothetical protein [Alphaproteobacteria bacterium]